MVKIRTFGEFEINLDNLHRQDFEDLYKSVVAEHKRRCGVDLQLDEFEQSVAFDNKIRAIKMYRNRTGALLKDALKVVDEFLAKQGR